MIFHDFLFIYFFPEVKQETFEDEDKDADKENKDKSQENKDKNSNGKLLKLTLIHPLL